MKILVSSDWHLDCYKEKARKEFLENLPEADILVFAGDMRELLSGTAYKQVINWLLNCKFEHIVAVAGNHEFYNCKRYDYVLDTLNNLSATLPNFHFLEKNSVEIDGQRFIGCTLWFPDKKDNYLYENGINDFRCIPKIHHWVYKKHAKSVSYLRENVRDQDIVVTHYLPSYDLVAKEYKDEELTRFFVAPYGEDIIRENNPLFWVYGHTHKGRRQIIGDTHCFCNPLGYPGENEWYVNKFFIERKEK